MKWSYRLDVGEYRVVLTADERDAIKAGSEALRVLQNTRTRSWDMWVAVGSALLLLRDKVLKTTHAPRPIGKTYNAAFSELISRFHLVIDGSTRKRLFELLENRLSVEEWRAKHPEQARKHTHPDSLWKAWQAWKSGSVT
jgi:hypothetical protein